MEICEEKEWVEKLSESSGVSWRLNQNQRRDNVCFIRMNKLNQNHTAEMRAELLKIRKASVSLEFLNPLRQNTPMPSTLAPELHQLDPSSTSSAQLHQTSPTSEDSYSNQRCVCRLTQREEVH